MRIIPGAGLEGGGDMHSQSREVRVAAEGITTDLIANGAVTTAKVTASADGNRWGVVATVDGSGGLEIGSYIDFHNSDADVTDYKFRIDSTSDANGLCELTSGVAKRIVTATRSTLAQGDILYYDGTNFVRLAPGTSGQFLRTNGAGANPQWADSAGGISTIASGSLPAAATLSITNIPATFAYLVLQLTGVSSDASARQLLVRVSTNNGSSYDSTAANYRGMTMAATALADMVVASLLETALLGNSAAWDVTIVLEAYQAGPMHKFWTCARAQSVTYINQGTYVGSASAINALQLLWSGSGNFDAGTYALYGVG